MSTTAWPEVALGDLMATRSRSLDPTAFQSEEFDLYSIPAYDSGQPVVTEGADIGSAKLQVEPGDVLISRIVPHIRRVWVVGPSRGRRKLGSSEWIVFRTGAHPEYMRHLLASDQVHSQFMRTVSGVGGSLLRARPALVAKIKVPLPPIEEQRRIAAVLDQADELRAKRRAALDLLDTLTESIFLDMFGDPTTNPQAWVSGEPLGEIAEISSGITKGRRLRDQPTRSVPYLAVANVQDAELRLDPIKLIDATDAEIGRYRLLDGDLVLTEGGDPDKLGRGTIWRGELAECIHQNHIFRVRLHDSSFDPEFVSRLLGSRRGRQYFLRSAKQTTGIASINKTQLCAFPMLSPPLELQRKFAKCLREREVLLAGTLRPAAVLDSLFASLQQRAFRGEL